MNQKDRNRLKKRARAVEALMDSLRELQQEHSDHASDERDKADAMMDSNLAETQRAQFLEETAQEMEDRDSEFDFALDQLQELADNLLNLAEDF